MADSRNKRGESYKATIIYSNGQHWTENFDKLTDLYEYIRAHIQKRSVTAIVISHVYKKNGDRP